jgi:poly(3-hydroxybutyrate) depolymerase
MTTRFFWIVYGLLFMAAGCRGETVEQVERARTFEAGRAAYAYAGSVVIEPVAVAWPKLRNLRRSNFKGTMVYLHGCDGINALSLQAADIFASAGYLVLMPDSFARLDKPVSCRPAAFQGSLHRDVLAWRQGEAEEAVRRAKTLDAVDPARIVLYGLSEGAIAVATYTGEAVRARIVEGWTCHAGWDEYRGLHASASEAVLTITSENDPWFQQAPLRGDCGQFLGNLTSLRRSVVFRPPHPAASSHDVLWNLDARRIVADFLSAAFSSNHE